MTFVWTRKTAIISSNASIILFVIVAACGGGGGGNGGTVGLDGPQTPFPGVTDQASISQDNAAELALNTFQRGRDGSGPAGVLSLSVEPSPVLGAYTPNRRFLEVLSTAIVKLRRSTQVNALNRALVSESGMESGSCGGSATITVTLDDVTGDFNGTINFNRYCELDVIVTGLVGLNGNDSDSSINMSFTSLSVEACGVSATSTGSASARLSGSTSTIDSNMRIRDSETGKVYWVNDFEIVLRESFNSVRIEESGRFYDPDYGYVIVSTPQALQVNSGDTWPSSGVIDIVGASGIAGGSSTRARLTAFNTSYRIDADTTGDGVFDFSETNAWPESVCSL